MLRATLGAQKLLGRLGRLAVLYAVRGFSAILGLLSLHASASQATLRRNTRSLPTGGEDDGERAATAAAALEAEPKMAEMLAPSPVAEPVALPADVASLPPPPETRAQTSHHPLTRMLGAARRLLLPTGLLDRLDPLIRMLGAARRRLLPTWLLERLDPLIRMLGAARQRLLPAWLLERLGRLAVLLLVWGLCAVLGLLPLSAAPAVGRLLGILLHSTRYRQATLRSNMKSLPLDEEDDGQKAERGACAHLGLAAALTLQPARRDAEMARMLAPLPAAELAALLADLQCGRGLILLSAHLGAWELLPHLLLPQLPQDTPVSVVYRPLHNARLDAWLLARRCRSGGRFLPDKGSLPELTASLLSGGMVCMLADQLPSATQRAVQVPFLGRASRFACGAGVLHEATGAPVWFGVLVCDAPCETEGRPASHGAGEPALPRLKLVLERLAGPAPQTEGAACTEGGTYVPALKSSQHAPLHGAQTERVACMAVGPALGETAAAGRPQMGEAGSAVIRAYADALSSSVRRRPAQYFWWHRRWKEAEVT